MEFALYRYEFEVMEKKDSSASLFPNQWDNLTPREAFDRKSELLDELLEKDYKMLDKEHKRFPKKRKGFQTENGVHGYALPTDFSLESCISPREYIVEKTPLQFTNGHKKPLAHKYVLAPKDGFTILELARLTSVSHRPQPFLTNTVKEDIHKSLHVIIDNRGIFQRIAIEVKPSALSTDAVAASLAKTLCEVFARYGLLVKVVPIRDDKYFWKIVNDKERYPKGFKKLLIEFPQINDPEVSKGLDELGLGYHRKHFGTGLDLLHKSPKGESIPFDENDAYQCAFMNIACYYGDKITLTSMTGSSISFGGECAKTGEMPDNIIQRIDGYQQSPNIFGMNDDRIKTMEYMNKFYTRR